MTSPKAAREARRKANRWDTAFVFLMATIGLVPSFVESKFGIPLVFAGLVTGAAFIFKKNWHLRKLEEPLLDDAGMVHSLQVLHAVLASYPDSPTDDPKHRICVYVKDRDNPSQLVRITPQVGHLTATDSQEPTVLPLAIGVVGKVARIGKPLVATLGSDQNLSEYLVSNWSFTEEIACTIRSDRKSWYGVPLAVSGRGCIGVLFCDSSLATFFGRDSSARTKILRTASVAIAEILAKSYS